MADEPDDPRLAAMRAAVPVDFLAPGEAQALYVTTMNGAQDVLLFAQSLAQRAGTQHVGGMTAAILEAAWAFAAAQAEDKTTRAEAAGFLVGVDDRLNAMREAVQKLYYPAWRQVLAEQGPKAT